MKRRLFFGKSDGGSRGFTLIEIMVSMALLAIVLVAVFRLFSQTMGTEGAVRFYTKAPLLARQKMAETIAGMPAEQYGGSGGFEDYPEYGWEISVTRMRSEIFGSSVGEIKQF